jgi:hypothetical protein
LVNKISGNCYQAYPSLNAARAAYHTAEAAGFVRVVRNPGDSEILFGTVENAMGQGMED